MENTTYPTVLRMARSGHKASITFHGSLTNLSSDHHCQPRRGGWSGVGEGAPCPTTSDACLLPAEKDHFVDGWDISMKGAGSLPSKKMAVSSQQLGGFSGSEYLFPQAGIL